MGTTTNYDKHTNQNPIQKWLIKRFYKKLLKTIEKLPVESILDVGCGEGFSMNKLKVKNATLRRSSGQELKIVGIDNSSESVKIGKQLYPNLDIRLGSIYDLQFKNSSFDLVLATEVLEHLAEPQKALTELRRVSKRYILLSAPNEPWFILANFLRGKYLRTFGNHPEHIQHWTSGGFERFLKSNGLRIVSKRHPFPWTLILAEKQNNHNVRIQLHP